MNSKELSQRLETVAQYVIQYGEKPIRLADIGSDHAYLPCNLALNNEIEYAIAGEIVEGPYQSAVEEVREQKLEKIIEVRKGDGLEVINNNDSINVVTICGMGGNLIRQILQQRTDIMVPNHLLVLQPNVAEPQLREWLIENHYQIINEALVAEHKHMYEIIVARHDLKSPSQKLTKRELFFGPINLKNKTDLFRHKWQDEKEKYNYIVSSMKRSTQPNYDKIKEIEKIINLIERELAND